MPYKLRSVIRGHESDIRSVSPAVYPEGAVLTASRDQTCRLWVADETSTNIFQEGHIFSGHTRYISVVATLPPSEKYPHGLVATGGHDNVILVFCLDSTEPVFRLEGHTGTVSSLMSGKFGTLLSGSWDTTARVWVNGQSVMELKGHTAAVWTVEMIPELGVMITGSADKSIKLWKAGKCEKTITGHTDCVRGLAVLSSVEFLSCSNDCTIRRWSTAGECLEIYSGHTNYIYSITVLPSSDGSFATCGEDRTIRIWKNSSCDQTITMPCTSVWAINCLANGDIIVGSSDGVARIFTSADERIAPASVLQEFEDEVANQAIPAAANLDLGDIKKEELPGPEALLRPGTKDGQTKLIKRDAVVEAHQWDLSQQRWQKVGEVVGAAGSEGSSRTSKKQVYNGKEYDYVFDVDIEEGKPPLKLPFNITDDPWAAAHQFLGANDMSPLFLDEVANFIVKNTEGVTLGPRQTNVSDPFTGGARYIPGSSSMTSVSDPPVSAFQDPFTGGSRYVPGSTPSNSDTQLSTFEDPFTGGTRYRPQADQNSDVSIKKTSAFFPKTSYLSFDTGKTDVIIAKLKAFNTQVHENYKLADSDTGLMAGLLVNFNPLAAIDENTIATVIQAMQKLMAWPVEMLFPGLDLIRLLIRHSSISERLLSTDAAPNFISSLLGATTSGPPVANSMLVQRIFCNCFCSKVGVQVMIANGEKVLRFAEAAFDANNKLWRVASSSTILNYCVILKTNGSFEDQVPLLEVICKLLKINMDGEAQFRLLVGLGTLLWNNADCISLAKSLDIEPRLEELSTVQDPPKVGECTSQLLAILRT